MLKHTGKRPLGRPRLRCEDNIRIDLRQIGVNARNWIVWAKARDYCECDIEPPGLISHEIS